MEKFKHRIWAVLIALLVVNVILGIVSAKIWEVDAVKVIELTFAFWGALSTTAVVVWSLFGDEIKAGLCKSNLQMHIARDDVHCVAAANSDWTTPTTPLSVLEIYASVSNDSKIVAKDVQLVCGRAFVSETGENFIPFKTFRAASFAWLYNNESSRFLATVRKSADKFAKVLEIVEYERSSDVKPDSSSSGATIIETQFKICLPLSGNLTSKIEVPYNFRAILLPIFLLAEGEETQTYYLWVYWKGVRIKGVPLRDELEVRFVSKEAAQDAVAVNIE